MTKHDASFHREVILEHVAALRNYTPASLDLLVTDAKTYDAILMRLMAIGEELAQMRDVLSEHGGVGEWHKIIGLRNRIAHGYWEVDRDAIWELLTDGSLDGLEKSLR